MFINGDGNPEIVVLYNELFNISCDATGKESVTMSWKKDGGSISAEDFEKPETIEIEITGPYDLSAGIHSLLKRKANEIEYTCGNVDHYSGQYTCESKNRDPSGQERSATSQPYVVKTHCE